MVPMVSNFIHKHAAALVVGLTTLAVFLVIVTNAGAARPSQRTSVIRAGQAVDNLCGGGLWVCVKRYPVDVFYNCGPNARCWNVCYTHREKFLFYKSKYKCSTGKIMYRVGFLSYYFEY